MQSKALGNIMSNILFRCKFEKKSKCYFFWEFQKYKMLLSSFKIPKLRSFDGIKYPKRYTNS